MDKPRVTIFDVDGTLADVRPLRHLLAGPRRDMNRFHQESAHARPNRAVVDALHQVRRDGELAFVVTARDGKWADLTLDWLDRNRIGFDGFVHRARGDVRADQIVKAEMLDAISRHHQVVGAYDDRPSVVRLWHSRQIPVTIVGGWFNDSPDHQPTPIIHVAPGEPLPALYAERDFGHAGPVRGRHR